ncbi:Uncharacterized conserved protein YraI [Paraburkholderia lycopersici]|uniref:Uncharacterized conserved protein YraI n=1 Tax=Paraburkholderia lycopersici TaxID=416944 RepID=A0A1G6RH89_9BURK|nr:Uncharacterized conserved protein YraI [Paraburkholderia lycopersici]
MRKQLVGVVLAGLIGLFAASPPARAQSQAFTNQTVNLYAGPAADFPIVAQVPGGVSVLVWGCVAGFSWCDVGLPGLRGWVYGSFISYPWQGQRVPVMAYGPRIGLPIVTFSLGAYWGLHYHDRPWFSNQSRWARHPGPRPVPPPAVRPRPPSHGAGRPPGGARPPGQGGHRPPDNAAPGNRPPGARPGNSGARPPGQGSARPPGQGNARPPGQGNARPPGQGGGRPPGQGGGRPSGGGDNRPQGGGGGGSGGRPPGG